MFQTILFFVALTFSVVASGQTLEDVNDSHSYRNFLSTLDQALSFDETIDHEILDAVKERKKYYDSGAEVSCNVELSGILALEYFEKSILNMPSDWLTIPQRKSMESFFSGSQSFDICKVQNVAPKSDDFYQATVVFIVRYTENGLNSVSALRLDWFDGDVVDEP